MVEQIGSIVVPNQETLSERVCKNPLVFQFGDQEVFVFLGFDPESGSRGTEMTYISAEGLKLNPAVTELHEDYLGPAILEYQDEEGNQRQAIRYDVQAQYELKLKGEGESATLVLEDLEQVQGTLQDPENNIAQVDHLRTRIFQSV